MKSTQITPEAEASTRPRQEADASTRHRVASSILEQGPSTAAALAERLGLTPAAIRRHLDALLATGQVEAREQRVYGARGRGRPAKVFALTDSGRAGFYTAYDTFANQALGYLAEVAGPDAVTRFAEQRIAEMENRYARRLATADAGTTPAQALAAALTDDGYVAATLPSTSGEQLCSITAPWLTCPAVPAAVRGRDPCLLPAARGACPAAGHYRPWRRCLHHPCPTYDH